MLQSSTPLKLHVIEGTIKTVTLTPPKLNIIRQTTSKMFISSQPIEKQLISSQPIEKQFIVNVDDNYKLPKVSLERPSANVNIINVGPVTDHMCYILKSDVAERVYIGYTINFERRLRQHNGEIIGGAKKTKRWRPWSVICTIKGFYDVSAALRFEFRLQHNKTKKKKDENIIDYNIKHLIWLINNGDGSADNKIAWPTLHITWVTNKYTIEHTNVINNYM